MSTITVESVGDQLRVVAPYVEQFPPKAKMAGGRWAGATKTWVFDQRDAERVYGLLDEFFAWTPDADAETCTVRLTLTEDNAAVEEVALFGVTLARRKRRDSEVTLGDKVVVVDGVFAERGGSNVSPKIISPKNPRSVVIEWRDVTRHLAERIDPAVWAPQIIGQESLDRAALEAEKARLVARIAEIDQTLAN